MMQCISIPAPITITATAASLLDAFVFRALFPAPLLLMTAVIITAMITIIIVMMITGRLVIELILEGVFFQKARVGAQDVGSFTGIEPFRFCCSTQLLLLHHSLQHFPLEITLKGRALALFDLLD